jgi:TolB-like protein
LLAIATLLGTGPAFAKPILAVMDIQDQTRSLSAALVDSLTESLRSLLARSGQFVVIDRTRQAAELRKLVTKQKKESYKDCYDERCQIPLGQELAADSILRTTLSRVGSRYLAIAEVVDLAKVAVTGAAEAEVAVEPAGERDDRLLKAVSRLARQLTGNRDLKIGRRSRATLASAPAASSPAEVRGMSDLERPTAQEPGEERPAQARPPAAQASRDDIRDRRRTLIAWGLALAGAGAIVVAAGAAVELGLENDARAKARAATTPTDLKRYVDEGHDHRVSAWVCVGVGSAAVVGGLALVLLAPKLARPVRVAGMELDRLPGGGAAGPQAFLLRWGGRF